jgi:cell shape-determining protein MreC
MTIMTYLLKSKRGNTPHTKISWAVFLSIVCILILLKVVGYTPFSRLFVAIGAPFWNITQSVTDSVSSAISLVHSKQSLVENQNLLESKIAIQNGDIAELTVLRDENATLKEMLGRVPFKRALLSAVLSNPTRTPYDTLVIDAGKELGVVSGAKVSVREMVVGEIVEVTPTWSRVRLFSSPGEEHPVIIGKTKVTALATGLGAGNFDAKLPRELDVVSGDTVTFPELNKQVVGVVEAIEVTPNDSFQRILFKSPINLTETRFVEVELGPIH